MQAQVCARPNLYLNDFTKHSRLQSPLFNLHLSINTKLRAAAPQQSLHLFTALLAFYSLPTCASANTTQARAFDD